MRHQLFGEEADHGFGAAVCRRRHGFPQAEAQLHTRIAHFRCGGATQRVFSCSKQDRSETFRTIDTTIGCGCNRAANGHLSGMSRRSHAVDDKVSSIPPVTTGNYRVRAILDRNDRRATDAVCDVATLQCSSKSSTPAKRDGRYVHDAVLDMLAARNELMRAHRRGRRRDWERYVPYGSRTLHELLAHLAGGGPGLGAGGAGSAARGVRSRRAAVDRTTRGGARSEPIERGRAQPPAELLGEMERRRQLLLSLYELLEPRHLALSLRVVRRGAQLRPRAHLARLPRPPARGRHPPRAANAVASAAAARSAGVANGGRCAVARRDAVRDLQRRSRALGAALAGAGLDLPTAAGAHRDRRLGAAASAPARHRARRGRRVAGHRRRGTRSASTSVASRTDSALVEEYLSMRHETTAAARGAQAEAPEGEVALLVG